MREVFLLMKYNLTTLKIYFKQGRKLKFFCQIRLKYKKIVFKYWKYILNTLKSVSKYMWFCKGVEQLCIAEPNKILLENIENLCWEELTTKNKPSITVEIFYNKAKLSNYYAQWCKAVRKPLQIHPTTGAAGVCCGTLNADCRVPNDSETRGDPAYESGGDARLKFWIKPLKETDLCVAQAFSNP